MVAGVSGGEVTHVILARYEREKGRYRKGPGQDIGPKETPQVTYFLYLGSTS
jgi:hypothetical protein